MKVPSLVKTAALLREARDMNPGPWVDHPLHAGTAARVLAGKVPGLDCDVAFSLGALHDIGRRFGRTKMRHCLDGYKYLMALGYDDAARICLTHSFPWKHIDAVFGEWDCNGEEKLFVADYLAQAEYTAYDKLIQLCDALAMPSGFCLLEKRMVEVAVRCGTNQYTAAKWKATFACKAEFEQVMGASIYTWLPGVVENTFN